MNGEWLLCVGGRMEVSKQSHTTHHPILLPRDHRVLELLIAYKHLQFLHATPTLVSASLVQRSCIVRRCCTIHAKFRHCVTCKCIGARAKLQILRRLPMARLNLRDVFDNTGIDYTGPINIKSRPVHKPIIIKGCVAVFVLFSVKAVPLEPVTQLTMSASWLRCIGSLHLEQ